MLLLERTSLKELEMLPVSEYALFTIDAKGNSQISWTLKIPKGLQAVEYKVIARAGDFSDGEQNTLPVLTNRMLVTETLPMWIKSNELENIYFRQIEERLPQQHFNITN